MKTIQVTYTVQAGFAAQNKINIQAVMTDLQQLHRAGLLYHACVKDDTKHLFIRLSSNLMMTKIF
ncbi:MAG: hypothetical protein IPG82_18140 [Saprospiraceae bacterium]|nr:hypothetical protein [Saprospiraceae bacterium]